MRKLYVAATEACRSAFECEREVIDFDNANFTEVSIAVMTAEEAKAGKLERVESTAFGIPVVILNECGEVDPTLIGRADSIIDCKADDAKLYGPENRGIYTQSDSPKKSSRNIWSLAVVSVDQRY